MKSPLDDLTWYDVDSGKGVQATVMEVLRGGGTPAERMFVWTKVSYQLSLAIAIADAGRLKVTVEQVKDGE